MKYTNKFNLPESIVNAVKRPSYSRGKSTISVTQLINSPQIVALREKHGEDIEVDVSDQVWALFGSAVHHILEQGASEKHLVEERIFTSIGEWVLSGAVDVQICHADGTRTIQDYKVTRAYSVMNEKKEWEEQLNIYGWLVRKVKKTPVKELQIVAIIRDWNRNDAARNPDYPPCPFHTINIPLWDLDRAETFIRDRLNQHQQAYASYELSGELPTCSSEDMWERPTTYAVMKKGNVRATKVYPIRQEAEAHAKQLGAEVVVRQGERIRCANFCDVKSYCQQWRTYESSLASAD